ncbi:MAG: hypothetical protein ACE5IM_00765 [Nitrospinota bacterium]
MGPIDAVGAGVPFNALTSATKAEHGHEAVEPDGDRDDSGAVAAAGKGGEHDRSHEPPPSVDPDKGGSVNLLA